MNQKIQDAIDVTRDQECADTHPIVIQKIDICTLASRLSKSGAHSEGMADLAAVKSTKLRAVVKEIATDLPKRLSHYKAAEIITQHVRDNCDCLPLTAFEKWNNELKTSLKKDAPVKLFE